jgi:hypothetical protein
MSRAGPWTLCMAYPINNGILLRLMYMHALSTIHLPRELKAKSHALQSTVSSLYVFSSHRNNTDSTSIPSRSISFHLVLSSPRFDLRPSPCWHDHGLTMGRAPPTALPAVLDETRLLLRLFEISLVDRSRRPG